MAPRPHTIVSNSLTITPFSPTAKSWQASKSLNQVSCECERESEWLDTFPLLFVDVVLQMSPT